MASDKEAMRCSDEPRRHPSYAAKEYSESRPTYPEELFRFIASKTPCHDLAWDAGTGTGQAARSLAALFKNVIATDISPKQLDFAPKLPNVKYQCTPPDMSSADLEQIVAGESSVDLVTVATALHYFEIPAFFQQVKRVLKKPHGVIAVWSYFMPRVNGSVDPLVDRLWFVDCDPYWVSPKVKVVIDKYKRVDFPFEPVDGLDNTEPFEKFEIEKVMDLDSFFGFIRSWSAYQIAKEKGEEFLKENVMEEFRRAWNEDGNAKKTVKFPIFLRIGRVGNLN